jgi:hypothetical protein
MTHPGVRPLTALATVLVLGPVTRFPTSKHVVSYIGLAPAVAASAEKCRLGHITKQGNTPLRSVLGQAGLVAARSHPDLRRLYSVVTHRHGHAKAKVAVARKLLVRLSIMLRNQIDYAEFRDRSRRPRVHPARRGQPASLTSGATLPRGLRSPRHEVQCGRSRTVRGHAWDRVLIGTPTLDDPTGSSMIEHDIMRRGACAKRWTVDSCGPRTQPSVARPRGSRHAPITGVRS